MKKTDISKNKNKIIINEIKFGKIFIYPTDTIYGIGCDATNKRAVKKIKKIKKRDKNKPLSIIAPSKKWIKENFITDYNISKYLPGPYTLILKKKNPNFLNHISKTDSIGIRIPNNNFTKVIQKSNLPFVTTSVNLAGETPIKNTNEIPEKIKYKINYIIDRGPLTGRPSTLIIDGKKVER
ncbi:threonylcarbamoyl-AMP synthase [Candidatus Pacearchaeota archaeon]|nr:threonylcarbamoyl-AMP synthase [Candidatus Pacearchaeota archaeon]